MDQMLVVAGGALVPLRLIIMVQPVQVSLQDI